MEQPYLTTTETITVTSYKYNPKYGDNRRCKCEHTYARHFDTYEDMEAIGCKYCQCDKFTEAKPLTL